MYKNIMSDVRRCYLCGSYSNIEYHHILGGGKRKLSTKYGLVVPLCRECHRGSDGVHSNYSKMRYLRECGQRRFQEVYPELDFMKIFGRNYL